MTNITSDVRRSIPFTALTDPAAFPAYEHREYPKMMLKPDGKPYMGVNELPITVHDEDEETAFRAENETLTIVNDRQLNQAERNELEELRALRDQKSGDEDDPRQPAAETVPNRLASLTQPTAPTRSATKPNNKGQQLKDRGGARLPPPIKSGSQK